MIKRIIASLIIGLSTMMPALVPIPVYATASGDAICEGANDGTGSCTDDSSGEAVSKVIQVAIRIFQGIIGIISLFVMLTAGLNYVTSGGDAAKTKSAREKIIYAVIGLVIVGVAEILVQFALNRVNSTI